MSDPIRISHAGLNLTISDWCARLDLTASTVRQRLYRGLPTALVLSREPLPPDAVRKPVGGPTAPGNARTRAVMTPRGRFESMTEAAAAFGVTTACVVQRAREGRAGFSYINDDTDI